MRVVENKDWVIGIVMIAVLLYIISSRLLHKDLSLWEYLHLKYYENNNAMLSWILVSLSHIFLLGALISQFIPIVPKSVVAICNSIGFVPNKMGFFTSCMFVFYLLKSALTYLFFAITGNLKRWYRFYFITHKFYIVLNIFMVVLILMFHFTHYPISSSVKTLPLILGGIYIVKLAYLIMHQQFVLPKEWYYKFLYLCSLQIIPSMVLVKILYI